MTNKAAWIETSTACHLVGETLQGESDNERNETGADLPIEYLREYDGAAEHYAKQGALPHCMGSPGALDYINADPEAFEQRVRDFKYAHAMEATHARNAQQGEPTSFSAWLERNNDSIEPLDRVESASQWFDNKAQDEGSPFA